MKKEMKAFGICLAMLAFTVVFLGCPQTPETTTVEVTGVSISTDSGTSVTVGSTLALDATVTPSNATDKTVTWTSSNTSVATVTSAGIVTGKTVGTATITAKAGSKSDSVTITVKAVESTSVAVTGVTITGDTKYLYVGASVLALSADVTPSNATDKTVTWTSSDTSVATVSSSGVVTPKARGTATITATSGSVFGTYEISVLKYIKAEATDEGIKVTIQKDDEETVNEYSQVQETSSWISFMICNDAYKTFSDKNTYSFIYPFTTKGKEYTFAFNAEVTDTSTSSNTKTSVWETITCTATTTTDYANFVDTSIWNTLTPTVKYDYANKNVTTSSGLSGPQFEKIFADEAKLSERNLNADFWYGLDTNSDGSLIWTSCAYIGNSTQDQLAEGFKFKEEFSFTISTDKVFSDYNYIYAIALTYAFRLSAYSSSEWRTQTIYSAGNNIFASYTSPSDDIVGTWVSSDSTEKFYFMNTGVFYGLTYNSSASKPYSYRKGIYVADTDYSEIFVKVQYKNTGDLTTEESSPTQLDTDDYWTSCETEYEEYSYTVNDDGSYELTDLSDSSTITITKQ